ncbi:hypothetical protein niasHS_007331 [Heterodera schachtii]|uniref:Uncharacterized protein n=1 Tax=Heterodera schachtii TaxID=97005 RepID=A0ABD2JK23_HETSC
MMANSPNFRFCLFRPLFSHIKNSNLRLAAAFALRSPHFSASNLYDATEFESIGNGPKSSSSKAICSEYLTRVAEGNLKRDNAQLKVIEHFDRLLLEIVAHSEKGTVFPSVKTIGGFFSRLFADKNLKRQQQMDAPMGIYLHGAVGK